MPNVNHYLTYDQEQRTLTLANDYDNCAQVFRTPAELSTFVEELLAVSKFVWGGSPVPPPSLPAIKLEIAQRELLAALGFMLTTWDTANLKMVAFMREQNKETAEAYCECFPKLFDAACLGKATYQRYVDHGGV